MSESWHRFFRSLSTNEQRHEQSSNESDQEFETPTASPNSEELRVQITDEPEQPGEQGDGACNLFLKLSDSPFGSHSSESDVDDILLSHRTFVTPLSSGYALGPRQSYPSINIPTNLFEGIDNLISGIREPSSLDLVEENNLISDLREPSSLDLVEEDHRSNQANIPGIAIETPITDLQDASGCSLTTKNPLPQSQSRTELPTIIVMAEPSISEVDTNETVSNYAFNLSNFTSNIGLGTTKKNVRRKTPVKKAKKDGKGSTLSSKRSTQRKKPVKEKQKGIQKAKVSKKKKSPKKTVKRRARKRNETPESPKPNPTDPSTTNPESAKPEIPTSKDEGIPYKQPGTEVPENTLAHLPRRRGRPRKVRPEIAEDSSNNEIKRVRGPKRKIDDEEEGNVRKRKKVRNN